jgi:hypothetical protein
MTLDQIEQLGDIYYRTNVAGQDNFLAGFTPDVENIFDVDTQGRPVYINEQGFRYQVKDDGNITPYIEKKNNGNGDDLNSLQKGWRWLLDIDDTGYFSSQTPGEQPQQPQAQQQSMTIDEAVNNFKQNNPDLTYREIAERLSDMDPEAFEQRTGLPLNSVIDRLRMMR